MSLWKQWEPLAVSGSAESTRRAWEPVAVSERARSASESELAQLVSEREKAREERVQAQLDMLTDAEAASFSSTGPNWFTGAAERAAEQAVAGLCVGDVLVPDDGCVWRVVEIGFVSVTCRLAWTPRVSIWRVGRVEHWQLRSVVVSVQCKGMQVFKMHPVRDG